MAKINLKKIDFNQLQLDLQRQFVGLDAKDPSIWPPIPRFGLLFFALAAVVVLFWFLLLSDSKDELEQEQAKEITLKEDYKKKIVKAVNLELLLKQREQVQQYVTQLEKQLPGKAEMDALLSDINQAGLGRSLQFDLFKPGQVVVKDYYAELPISIKISGKYHDMGAFAADIASLPRIVTLNNISISSGKDASSLAMEAVAKTYRYLDPDEIESQKKAAKGVKK